VGDLILKREIGGTRDAIEKSASEGMVTFDQSLFDLFDRNAKEIRKLKKS